MRRVPVVAALSMALGCGEPNDAANGLHGGECTGNGVIARNAGGDALAARGCTSLAGILYVTGTSVTGASLPALTRMTESRASDDGAENRRVEGGRQGHGQPPYVPWSRMCVP